jgi:acyl dehydratase
VTITIDDLHGLRVLIGQDPIVSDWITITQEHIDQFADATGDYQWIHLDAERAARESPFQTTVAHGFLTLSLLSQLLGKAVKFARVRMGVNYGLNRVRFTSPVPAGARVRGRFALLALEDIPDNGMQMTWGVTMEREGTEKPCLVAEWLTRRYE